MFMNRNRFLMALWLIGVGIMVLTHSWWPGLLILIGVSILMFNLDKQGVKPPATPAAPDAAPPDWVREKEAELPPALADTPVTAPAPARRADLLPANCPSCGGPVFANRDTLEWTGPAQAKCPFCGTVLSATAS
jgi:hypothetical protein